MSGYSGARLDNLPVEVRDMDFALLGRATVGTAAEQLSTLQDPSVYLSVTLPDGAQVGRAVDCGEHRPRNAAELASLLAELPTISAFIAADRESDRTAHAPQPIRPGISFAALPGIAPTLPWRGSVFAGAGSTAADPTPLVMPAAPASRSPARSNRRRRSSSSPWPTGCR